MEENTVEYLQSINFDRLTLQQKIDLKGKGRPIPSLMISKAASSRGMSYVRQFNADLYSKNVWLCGCNKKNALFCFPCLLFGGDSAWAKTGIKDLVHITRKIGKHKASKSHVNNMLNLSLLGSVNIASQLDAGYKISLARHNKQVAENRKILSKIIDCVKFCGRRELPLRGHNETNESENPGVFRGLVDFACEIDSSLRAHLESNLIFKETSKTIQNDILESILDLCRNQIRSEIESSDFLAVMCDETTNVHDRTQMVIVFRYEALGKVVKRFWGFFNPPDLTAASLASILLGELDKVLGNDHTKLVAQTYDGAAAMSGSRTGLQIRIKEQYPNAHFIHCYVHQFNLIMQKACSQNRSARIFFNNLSGIYTLL